MGNIIFNGISSKDLGVEVETFPDYVAPQKEFEAVHVPGRNGDVLIDTGAYQNVSRPYKINAYAPADPVQTKSGSVVSFNSSAAIPLKDLECEITPKQDLHGYDHPWPAGAGKNLLNYDEWKILGVIHGTAVWENNGVTLTATENDCFTNYAVSAFVNAKINVTQGERIILSWEEPENKSGRVYIFPNAREAGNVSIDNTEAKQLEYIVPEGVDYISFRFGVNLAGTTISYKNIQINKGTKENTWTPYANICPIEGYTEENITRCGKNLHDLTPYNSYTNIVTFGQTRPNWEESALFFPIGTYTFSLKRNEPEAVLFFGNRNGPIAQTYGQGATSLTFNVTEAGYYSLWLWKSGIDINDYSEPQVQVGSTATEYEAYNGHTFTVSFGQTVYGGVYDKSGRMTITWGAVDLGSLDWIYDSGLQRFQAAVSGIKRASGVSELATGILCEALTVNSDPVMFPTPRVDNTICRYTDNDNVYVLCSAYSDTATFKTAMNGIMLAYELATPIVINVPSMPVLAERGVNIIFSDAEEIEVTFGGEAFSHVMSRISEWLLSPSGYSRLEDTYDKDVYRMAYYGGNPNIANIFNEAGQADIEFICKPQRFLKSGEKSIIFNSNGTINNFTNHPALPLLKIVSNNTLESGSDIVGTIYIGNHALSIKNDETIPAGTNITIIADCELQNAYSEVLGEEINRNNLIVLNGEDMPRIEPGIQQITFDGGIQSVEVIPRWWTV